MNIGTMMFFFSSRRRHTRFDCDWSSDVCSSDLVMIRERPFLGWGPVENQVELERRLQDPGYVKRDAHNLLLELLTSTGVAGTNPFLLRLPAGGRSPSAVPLRPPGAPPRPEPGPT